MFRPRWPIFRKHTAVPNSCFIIFCMYHETRTQPSCSSYCFQWTTRSNLIYKDECLFVWNLYKFTFLNRSEPNFAHVSPLVWKRPQGMYGPEILDLFDILDPFSLGATAESWVQNGCLRERFPRYPYILDSSWCLRDVTDMTLSQMAQSSAATF